MISIIDSHAGVYHSFLVDKIKEKKSSIEESNIIKREEMRKFLCSYNVPRVIHSKFIKELEESGLVRVIDKQNIEVCV